MDRGPFVDNDQRPLELAHVFRIDAEIGLQRKINVHARRNVNERAPRPDGRVEGRELVVTRGNDRGKILPEQVGIIFESRVGVGKDDTFLREVFLQAAVDDFRLVLRLDAGEVFLFRLGNSQAVVGFADVFGDVAPVPLLAL